MKNHTLRSTWRSLWTCTVLLIALLPISRPAQADATDAWWDDAWPYRIPVTAQGVSAGPVSNRATFSGTQWLDAEMQVFVARSQLCPWC
jgi:hypothetical protein